MKIHNSYFIHYVCFLMVLLVSFKSNAQQVEYSRHDSLTVVELLRNAKKERGDENAMLYFGKKFLGIPYVAHTLENGDREHLIVNLHGLDCTTFVETVLALKLCDEQGARTFHDFCNNLTRIRYRQGKLVDYTSRLHYFTWWGEDNETMGIVKQVVADSSPFSAVQTVDVDYMTKNPNLYKQLKNHPEFIPVIRKHEQEYNGRHYRYIPKSKLNMSRASLGMYIKDGDIISIITNKQGLDTSHIGIAFWQGGQLHLMHASSMYKKVVMDQKTFYDYSQAQKAHTGIRVYRPISHKNP